MPIAAKHKTVTAELAAPTTRNPHNPDTTTFLTADSIHLTAVIPTATVVPRHNQALPARADLPSSWHSPEAAVLTVRPARLRIWQAAGATVSTPDSRFPREAHFWDLLPKGVLACAVARQIGEHNHGTLLPQATARAAVKSIRRHCECHPWPRSVTDWHAMCAAACASANEALHGPTTGRHHIYDADTALLLMLASPDCVCVGGTDNGTSCLFGTDGTPIGLPIGRPDCPAHGIGTVTSANIHAAMYRGSTTHVALANLALSPLLLEHDLPVPSTGFLAPVIKLLEEAPNENEAGQALCDHLHSSTVTAAIDKDVTLLIARLV